MARGLRALVDMVRGLEALTNATRGLGILVDVAGGLEALADVASSLGLVDVTSSLGALADMNDASSLGGLVDVTSNLGALNDVARGLGALAGIHCIHYDHEFAHGGQQSAQGRHHALSFVCLQCVLGELEGSSAHGFPGRLHFITRQQQLPLHTCTGEERSGVTLKLVFGYLTTEMSVAEVFFAAYMCVRETTKLLLLHAALVPWQVRTCSWLLVYTWKCGFSLAICSPRLTKLSVALSMTSTSWPTFGGFPEVGLTCLSPLISVICGARTEGENQWQTSSY